MKTKPEWIQQADNALKRAAKRAREIARRTNTAVHVIRDGKIIKLMPDPRSIASARATTRIRRENRVTDFRCWLHPSSFALHALLPSCPPALMPSVVEIPSARLTVFRQNRMGRDDDKISFFIRKPWAT